MRILVWMFGVIQGLDFLLGFAFPTSVVAADVRILSKQVICKDKFCLPGKFSILESASLVKQDKSTPLRCHLADLGMTGC